MSKPVFVWCSDSVDTSAVQLAQALDAQCVKSFNNEEMNINDNIIFYGNVQHDLQFNKHNMYNNPAVGFTVRNKKTFLESLGTHGVVVPKLSVMSETSTYQKTVQTLGAAGVGLDMLEKGTMKVLGTVNSVAQFNALKASAAYAARHYNTVKKFRIFFGNKNVTGDSVIGVTYSEYRTLNFKETLKIGRSADVQLQIDDMFEKGLLNDTSGTGITAWTESNNKKYNDVKDDNNIFTNSVNTAINSLYNAMTQIFHEEVDFFSADILVEQTGMATIYNVTTSPSLQNVDILDFVSDYFKHLLNYGRISVKQRVLNKIDTLSIEKIKKVLSMLESEEVAT